MSTKAPNATPFPEVNTNCIEINSGEEFPVNRTLHSGELEADATERQRRSGRVKLQLQCFVLFTRYFYSLHSSF